MPNPLPWLGRVSTLTVTVNVSGAVRTQDSAGGVSVHWRHCTVTYLHSRLSASWQRDALRTLLAILQSKLLDIEQLKTPNL